MTPARAILLLLLAIGALVAGGCGGDGQLSKTEYAEKVRSVYGEVQEAFQRTNVTSLTELADRVADAQQQLRDAAAELEDTQPPEDVAAEHAQLAEGMRGYAEDLDRLRNAAEQGDERTIEDFNARIALNKSVEQMAEAAERMKFKGYDLGQIAEE
ncbi:MAG: hypothetical protein ACRDOF_06375, partial [Gaiellaceae bacterium]